MDAVVNDSVLKNEERMVLRTENLVKRYGKRTVVNNVSFNVKQGEIVGLLGPNGAGKTTSFYMTTGLVVPNDGRIFLNDDEITKFPVYILNSNHILRVFSYDPKTNCEFSYKSSCRQRRLK